MVILVSNIAIDHCHHEKKWPTMISSAPASLFASPTFVYASSPAFFHFALVFFGSALANP